MTSQEKQALNRRRNYVFQDAINFEHHSHTRLRVDAENALLESVHEYQDYRRKLAKKYGWNIVQALETSLADPVTRMLP